MIGLQALEMTCRYCGAVGWTNTPPAGWEHDFHRHLSIRCPECERTGPRTRTLQTVPLLSVPSDVQAGLMAEAAGQ